jgi:hypothetical protein
MFSPIVFGFPVSHADIINSEKRPSFTASDASRHVARDACAASIRLCADGEVRFEDNAGEPERTLVNLLAHYQDQVQSDCFAIVIR